MPRQRLASARFQRPHLTYKADSVPQIRMRFLAATTSATQAIAHALQHTATRPTICAHARTRRHQNGTTPRDRDRAMMARFVNKCTQGARCSRSALTATASPVSRSLSHGQPGRSLSLARTGSDSHSRSNRRLQDLEDAGGGLDENTPHSRKPDDGMC